MSPTPTLHTVLAKTDFPRVIQVEGSPTSYPANNLNLILVKILNRTFHNDCKNREYVHSVAVYQKYLTRLGERITFKPWRTYSIYL